MVSNLHQNNGSFTHSSNRIIVRNSVLIITVGDGNSVGQVSVIQVKHVVQELDVGLIGVCAAALPLSKTAGRVVVQGNRLGDGASVLHVQVGLVTSLGSSRWTLAVVHLNAGKSLVSIALDSVALHKGFQVGGDGVLLALGLKDID